MEKQNRLMIEIEDITIFVQEFPNNDGIKKYYLSCRDLDVNMIELKEVDFVMAKKEALHYLYSIVKKLELSLIKAMDNKGAGYTS